VWVFHCAHITVNPLTFYGGSIIQNFAFFSNWFLNFFFLCNCILFGPNSRAIKSNLFTKDKIKWQGTKVRKVASMNDGFKVHTKKLILSSHFKNYTYLVPQYFFQFNLIIKVHFCYFLVPIWEMGERGH